MKIAYLAPLLALLLLGACAENQTVLTTEEKLVQADEFYAKAKYNRAAELYLQVYTERSSASISRALLREADCYFRLNRFTDARLAYQEFIETFPNSPDISTAYYRSAQCLYEESLSAEYDQLETNQSIDAFRKFIDKYPSDPRYSQAVEYVHKAQYKLIEKKYLKGYIYYKMKDYSSALMYFTEVTDLGNTDSLDREALYYSALLLHQQKLDDKARAKYAALVAKYPGSKESKKLAKLFK
jgi:outer membrane protein assembly factor BamD